MGGNCKEAAWKNRKLHKKPLESTKRRQLSRRKCHSLNPRQSTLFQNYIKSLNLESRAALDYQKNLNSNTTMQPNSTLLRPSMNKPKLPDFCPAENVVPGYDYKEVPDFSFDANIYQENCSIDSLLNQMSSPPTADDHDDMASLMQCEVKKAPTNKPPPFHFIFPWKQTHLIFFKILIKNIFVVD